MKSYTTNLARLALTMLLLLMTTATAWAKDPFGFVDICTGQHGSIYLDLWALDEDDLNARTTIHVYLRQNGQDKYVYNLGPTDIYRADEPNPQFAGYHKMKRYISVPVAGTYDVYVYVLNVAGDGGNPLCEHTWKGTPYPNYASVTTSSPYTVTYNANGGGGAPSATTKSHGINLPLSSTQPSRSGYLFTGWNTAANGSGTAYSSGSIYTGNADLTLYAQWSQSGNNSVEMASGTQDASHWSFSSGTANFGNTITVNYSGSLLLESVTLRRKTTNTYELNSSNISTAVSNFNSDSGSRLVFNANISEQQTFTCTEGEIDMNGHSSSTDLLIQNNELGKTITIKNGTVTGTDGAGGFNDYYNGTVVLENMTVTGRVWTDGHPYIINGGTYAEIINDINANTSGIVTIYDGKFSQLGNWGTGGTFTLYGGKYAVNPSSLSYCTIPSGYSVQSNTGSDSGTYPWVVRNTSSPVANPYSHAVTEITANRQWTFTMPPYDVEVVANYVPSYLAYNTATGGFDTHPIPGNITAVTSGTTTMNSGWYIVNSDITISTRITVNGTVNLILADGYSLTASQGITVNSGNTLNIYGQTSGTGALNATGAKLSSDDGTEAAGIGSTGYSTVGNITIHGGRITATGAEWSAGIGGGVHGGGGSITIYGGTISAIAGAPNHGNQDAIGSGASGSNGTKTLADGLRVTTYNNTTPFAYGNRVNAFYEKVVKVEPCTAHNLSNRVCTYCGLTIYNVTYNGNNATNGMAPTDATDYESGEIVTVLGNTGNLVRTGYTFSGWNTAANGSGTDYAAGTTFAISGNTTLYAKWTPITYTVRFNKNHNDATGTMSDQTLTYDVAQTLTANAFTRDGYDFVGWSTTSDGAVDYTDGQNVSNLANVQGTVVNLYARWATLYTLYTITYDLAGGTVATPNPTTYSNLSAAITLTNPTRDGYIFTGWTGTGLAEPTMTVTIPAGSTGNRSYTATWDDAGAYYLAYNTTTGKFETRMIPDNITSVTSSTTTMGAADTETWYTVSRNTTVSDRIEVAGTVNLILCDGKTLTASQGLHVQPNATLNIYCQTGGTGALTASTNNWYKAAIGSDDNSETGGTITIHGGVVRASSSYMAAAIGGGIGGSVIIRGGTVTATGDDSNSYSAGIGSGYYGKVNSITITGGIITASGTSNAIGVGAGGDYGTLNLGNMKVYASASATTPVASGSRESTCRSSYVKLMPCTAHNMVNGICTYCGFTIIHVTYDGNNATSGTVPTDATDYESGQTVTVLGNTGNLTRTGYTFGGWNTKADGSGTTYAEGETFTITSTLTLYAKWEARQLELANNAENDDAIDTAAGDGLYYDVTLAGHTLYRDGDWNTLVLPFSLSNFTGTLLEDATVKTLASTSFSNGTLTMTFSDNLTSIEAGKPYIVKWDDDANADLVIRTAAEWNTFADNVTNGIESYQGKVVKLAADISVSKMVGIESNPFRGSFDGCGHTLNVTLSGSDSFVAPFSHVNGCTIKNLIVTGTVNGGIHCTGLVGKGGETTNSNLIENCDVRVAVTCSSSHCGGFIGHSHMGTFTIRNCKFSGSISGATTYTGVFMGWAGSSATHVNCLAAGTYNVSGTLAISREDSKPNTYDNCYTTQAIGSDCTYTTATGSELQTLLGSGWEVRGGNVVPKMKSPVSGIVNPVFTNVIIDNTTTNIETTYANFIGSYAPFNDNNLLFDAHNPNGEAMHAALNITTPDKTGYAFGGWYTDESMTTPATTIPFAANGTVTLYARWTTMPLTLASNTDNSNTISTAAGEGMHYEVTLAGRTLYRDGDWNTLCLPFDVDDFSGTPLVGATVKTLSSSEFAGGTLTMTFSDDQTSIDAGVPYIVKWTKADLVIRSENDWNTFADNVNGGNSYQGKTVKLAEDISVSTMVGADGKEFKGTFDGCGHTLTFNYTTDADNAAPFQWIKNAVIKNLTVKGEITSSQMFAAGFVARAHGDNAIENCVSSVTIHATKVGDGTHGGFVGRIESDCKTFTFTNCMFNGTFDGSNTDNWCPFAAWSMGNNNTNFRFNNCLCSLAGANVRSGNATFYRNGTPTLNGAYYTQAIGTAQGTNASGMNNETLVSNLGSGWEVSGSNVEPKMVNTVNDIVNPVFREVTISNATANVSTTYVNFVGTYSPVIYNDENRSILFMGSGSSLYYPDGTKTTTIGACRAYFTLNGVTAGNPSDPPATVKAFVLNFGDENADGVVEVQGSRFKVQVDDAWYDLSGRNLDNSNSKIQNSKLPRGIYIHNGKKTIVK